jgi:hypothetical protein
MTQTLRFNDDAHLLVGLGLLGEAGINGQPVGANEVVVDDVEALDAEQREQLAKLVRDEVVYRSEAAGSPPGPAPVDELPPRTGPGSGREAWATAAERLSVPITEDMSRDEIVHAVDEAMEARSDG